MKKSVFTMLFLFFSVFPVTANANGTSGDGGWHMMGGGMFMWLLWVIVIGVVIYLLIDYSKKQRSATGETPLDILQKRYAKGEISREEYEQMKQDLER